MHVHPRIVMALQGAAGAAIGAGAGLAVEQHVQRGGKVPKDNALTLREGSMSVLQGAGYAAITSLLGAQALVHPRTAGLFERYPVALRAIALNGPLLGSTLIAYQLARDSVN